MRASLRLASHLLRVRWRAWLALALLTGVAGGAVLAAAAGARRTATAYPRFLAWSHASDMLIAPAGSGVGGYDDALARLPGVKTVAPVVGLSIEPVASGRAIPADIVVVASLDRRYGREVDRPRVIAGRLPDPRHPFQAAIDQNGAAELGLRVGSVLTLAALPNAGPSAPDDRGAPARPRTLRITITGILVTKSSVDPVTDLDKAPHLIASRSLWPLLGPRYQAFDGAEVVLRRGAVPARVGLEAQALARRYPATRGQVYLADEHAQATTVERAIKPASVALWLFALVLAVTAVLIVGQAASRALAAAAADNPALSALGMTRRQLTAAGLAGVAVTAAAGAVLAVVLAVAVSPLMPIGVARLAEPDPGLSADAVVLGTGGPVIVALLVVRAWWPARRLAAARFAPGPAAGRPSWLAGWLAGLSMPVAAVTGVRLALEPGRGRSAVPVRSVLAGTVLSVLAVTGAFTFGANLVHLVRVPELYGKTWDAAIDLQFGTLSAARAARLLGTDPDVAGWSLGDHGVVTIGHLVVPAVGIAQARGPVLEPTLLQGHDPRAARQIVLGTSTLHQIGKHVGDRVIVRAGGRGERFLITGRAVFPNFGQGSFTPTDLGQGALTGTAALAGQVSSGQVGPGYEIVLVKFRPGRSRATQVATLQRRLRPLCVAAEQSTCLVLGQQPTSITDYARIDAAPEVLGGLLALLGLAVLAQLIVTSARRRRRDFAVLRALGLVRHQISSIAAWQVTTIAVLALAAGLPLGVAAGRRAWVLFCGMLGVPSVAVVPVAVVLLAVPAVLILANAIAVVPGLAAARRRPAEVLRAE